MTIKTNKIEKQLLYLLKGFIQELGIERVQHVVQLNAHLEKDLGLGSLERNEFFQRIEQYFGIRFSQSILSTICTLTDLIEPIQQANPLRSFRVEQFSPVIEAKNIIPVNATTLVEVLQHYVQYAPERTHAFLQDEYGTEKMLTYGGLLKNAQQVASGLIQQGLNAGETVAIMLPTCEGFFYTFFGVLIAGGIPVPIYPPFRPDQIETYIKREAIVLSNAEVRILITFQKVRRLSQLLKNFIPSLKAITTCEGLIRLGAEQDDELRTYDIGPDHAGLIQYTSGSTGHPKGVLLTHQNMLANIRAYGESLQITPQDVLISWLPLYHDMGLIGAWFCGLYYGIPITFLSPITFLLHPERWLWAIHYHRGTISAGPNFAYELCIRRIDENMLEGLDLSDWRVALNGAEEIHPNTLRRFTEKLAPFGFKAETMLPGFGLAECSVALTIPPVGRKFLIDRVDRDKFTQDQIALKATDQNTPAMEFVSCGMPIPGHEIRIVNAAGKPVESRIVGELQFKGPSAMQGYYRNQTATQAIYKGGWWASGDYAYIAEGELYVTGRKKDIIIKAGRNYHPDHIEAFAAEVDGICKGGVSAFGVADIAAGTESFVIVAETTQTRSDEHERMIAQINEKIVVGFGIPPDQVILVPVNTVPKTASGKLRRSACKDAYLQGKLTKKGSPIWMQVIKLSVASGIKKIKKWGELLFRVIFGIYIGLISSISILIAWLVVVISPKKFAAKFTRGFTRYLLFVCGGFIKVIGREHLLNKSPVIFTANHASYLDALIMLAILPTGVVFISKQELFEVPVIKTFLKKLGHISVDRIDFAKRNEDFEHIQKTLQADRSILIFPEGTFAYATGVRPFKLGAFKLAAEGSLPICPIAIKGARKRLRSGTFFPRPGKIEVTILECIQPQGSDLRGISCLRTTTRALIAKHSGEAPLDLIVG